MDEQKLVIVILDDERTGTWEDLLKDKRYNEYIVFIFFDQLEKALRFVLDNYRNIHAVISDFNMPGAKGIVRRLSETAEAFTNSAPPTAMGANLTLLVESLKKKSDCTILVNKLYTTAREIVEKDSVESYILLKYYFSPEVFSAVSTQDKTSMLKDMHELLLGSLEMVQAFFMTRGEGVIDIQRKLENIYLFDLVDQARRVNIDVPDEVSEFNSSSALERQTFKEILGGIVESFIPVFLGNKKSSMSLASVFPVLSTLFDSYGQYYDGFWVSEHFDEFNLLAQEINRILQVGTDKTQSLGFFLRESKLTALLHGKSSQFQNKEERFAEILQKLEVAPLNEVTGLKEAVLLLNQCYSQFADSYDEYANFFYYGNCEGLCAEYDRIPEEKGSDQPFLGFRLDNKAVGKIVDDLADEFENLTIVPGTITFDPRDEKGNEFGGRIYTDKNRLKQALNYILKEWQKSLPKPNNRVTMSFYYDVASLCCKFIIEDNGPGMEEGEANKLGTGSKDDGGWADAINLLRGWVEDIWIVSKPNKDREPIRRSKIKREDQSVKEDIEGTGTKCVILFRLITDKN